MNITLEKIDLLIERANVTYGQAKEALEKADGDIVEALVYLEGQAKIKEPKKDFSKQVEEKANSFGQEIKALIKSINKNSLKVEKNNKTFIDLPLLIAGLIALFCLPFSIIVFAILLVTGYKINIVKEDGSQVDVNKNIKETVDKFEKKD